jgi:hypothetical protein
MRRASVRIGILVAALAATAVFAVVARADDPQFDQVYSSLQPGFVNAGSNVLYTAHWRYIDSRTLVHASVLITVPAGWTIVQPSDPTGCTQSGRLITCARGTIRPGDVIQQQVELQTDADLGSQLVTSTLTFYEGPPNPGRAQAKDNLPATVNVISANQTNEPNRAGKCVPDNGGSLSTLAGFGGSSTTADVPGTDELCTPVTIDERARISPDEACLPGVECVSDIVTTNAPAGSVDDPIQLTLVFYGTGLNNLPLIFNGGQPDGDYVDACTDPGAVPDPCYTGHQGRRQSVTWVVNWSGRDPGWDL